MTDARVQPNELTLELCSSRLLARTRMRPPGQMRPGAQGGLPRPRHGRRRHAAVATTRRVLYFPRMVVSDISVKLVAPFFQSARGYSRFSRNCPLARVFSRWAFFCFIFPQVYFMVLRVNFPFTGNFFAITVPDEFTSITPPLVGCRAKTVGPSEHGCPPGGWAHRGDAPSS